jgi:hypothetical protein
MVAGALGMLSACGDGGDGADESSGGTSAQANIGGNTGGTAGVGGSSGSGSEAGSGGSSAQGGSGSGGAAAQTNPDAEACAALPVEFSEPGAAEYVQWNVDGTEKTARPTPAGAYFFNGFLNLTTYAADFSGSVSIGVTSQQESLPAGTYRCHSGDTKASITSNNLSIANSTTPGNDCAVTYDADVEDGGRLQGSFWAHYAPSDWPIPTEGGCVHGRFDVTDAPDAD